MNIQNTLFKWISRFIVALVAMPFHEFSHGLVAEKLGDPTPRSQGRLTLNPFAHFDPLGTVFLVLTGYGWAKPVQVDPYYFKDRKKGMGLVALAGPMSNFLLAFILMFLTKLLFHIPMPAGLLQILYSLFWLMTSANIYLGVFNLIPIPPLDGSKILGIFLPNDLFYKYEQLTNMIPKILLLVLLSSVLSVPVNFIANAIIQLFDKILFFI